jgi:hypothetical protein
MGPRHDTASIAAVLELSDKVLANFNDSKDTTIDFTLCAAGIAHLSNRLSLLGDEVEKEVPHLQRWHNNVEVLTAPGGPLDQYRQALESLQTEITNEHQLEHVEASAWKFEKDKITSILDMIESLRAQIDRALQTNLV